MSKTIAVEVDGDGSYQPRREVLSPDINILGLPLFLLAILCSVYSARVLLGEAQGSLGDFPIVGFLVHLLAAVRT